MFTQLADVEERYKRDVNTYQDQTDSMQKQMTNVKKEMSQRLEEYQELLGVKLALDFEINTYFHVFLKTSGLFQLNLHIKWLPRLGVRRAQRQ